MTRVAYDTVLDRPGCAIVQAGMGADPRSCELFDAKHWLTAPTPDMRVYEASPEQLRALAARVNAC